MNQEQMKSGVRWVIATFGGTVAGWAAAKGFMSAEEIMAILTGESFMGVVIAVAGLVWGLFTHTKANTVAVVDAMPEVAKVITQPTVDGKALAKAVPSPTVMTANEPSAKS